MSARYQKPAILAELQPGRHAVIEASAGTGKTYTLEHLVIELLLTREVELDQILVVTFTEKATAELGDRVRKKIADLLDGKGAAPPEVPDRDCFILDEPARERLRRALADFDRACISTIHAFCQRILTEHAFASGRLLGERPIDERTAFSAAFRDVLRRRLAREVELAPFLDAWLRRTDDGVAKLEDLLYECHIKHSPIEPTADPARLRAIAAHFPDDDEGFLRAAGIELRPAVVQLFLPLVRAQMAAEKRDEGRFDFQDMLDLVADRLDGPDGARLTALLRRRFRFALIDEFQDTDLVQWRIFRKLFFEAGPSHSLFLIGDPKQAIYGFRGADVHTYLSARSDVRQSGGVVCALDQSFRATAPLLAATNAILDQRASPPFFTGEIVYDRPVGCGKPSRAALLADGRAAAPVVLLGLKTAKKAKADEVREALGRRMAEEIRALLDGALRVDAGDGEGPRPLQRRDIFVLTRSGSEAQLAGEHLRSAGVPHAFYKQEGLFQTAEAEDVRDLLAAIAEPHDPSRRCKAWLTPFFALGLGELSGARELLPTHPLYARLLEWKKLADDERWAELFSRILDQSGVLARALYRGTSERALTNYLHLFELLLEETARRSGSLAELCARLGAYVAGRALPDGIDGNLQRLESEHDAVQVMTMHMAKGLEAEVVFLFGGFGKGNSDLRAFHREGLRRYFLGSSQTPGYPKESIEREELEEDQRLLYVALTRARSRLYLPWFPKGSFDCRGSYQHVNAQLTRLANAPGFEQIPIRLDGDARLTPVPPAPPPLATFRPSAGLLDGPAAPTDWAALARAHAGFRITSYTRMKQTAQADRSEVAALELTGERVAEARASLERDELPGGAATGIFLHELLERIDLSSFAASGLEAWRARPEVRALVGETMRRHDRDPRHRAHAERLVYTAWSAPLRLGTATLERGLAGAARTLREVEFLYPWPERSHPRLGAPLKGPLTIERGYVKGFVDLVFEHQGRALFADWKSDHLADWDPAHLAAHVSQHYRVQARLYALALIKLLGVRDESDYEARFGGMVFCFLRGMRLGAEGGTFFERPRLEELRAWEERLIRGAPLDGDAP